MASQTVLDTRVCWDEIDHTPALLQVSGLSTNVGFLKRLCQHPAFEAAELDTSFIAKHMDSLVLPAQPTPDVVALAAVAWHLIACKVGHRILAWVSNCELRNDLASRCFVCYKQAFMNG